MDKIDEVLTRGVENIIPGKEILGKILRSGKKLNIYLGIDPTSPKIHLGHAVPLRKLQALVELGHNITFLVADFTAFIGDTSDKSSERPQLTEQEIEKNWQTYKSQAEKILDFGKVQIRHNSEWLDQIKFRDVIKLTRHFSLNDFIARELIKKRLTDGGSVNLSEVLYPLAQGYDSYELKTDLQIGGTEQIFNIQAGRTLIKDFDKRESYILTLSTLEGTDGRKMSKSWGNAIWIEDEASEMFGKVMSLKDDLINQYFTLATNESLENIEHYKKELESGINPMTLKTTLADKIVTELHGKEAAKQAREQFRETFQKGTIAKELIEEIKVDPTLSLVEKLVTAGIVASKSEAKRLKDQGAIEEIKSGLFRVGKKRFLKFV